VTLHFEFKFDKSLQASAHLLRLAGGRMKYIDLIKMLYLADRECLSCEGNTITGDRMSALPYGPVVSTVFNLIRRKDSQSKLWHKHIKTKGYNVILQHDPGSGDLYRFEKEILENIYNEYKDKDIVEFTHTLPEWKKYEDAIKSPNRPRSYRITIPDILDGIGKPELLDTVKYNIDEEKHHARLLGHQHR